MGPLLYIVLIIIVLIESSSGIALNLFIFIANLKGMKSRQKIKPPDLIHLTKGLVNVLLQPYLTTEVVINLVCFQKFFAKKGFLAAFISFYTLVFFNYWLSAILCAYYCSAISNLRFVVFVWMKRAITTFLPQLLLSSAMGSFLISVPLIWQNSVTPRELSIQNSTNDSMIIEGTFFFNHFYQNTIEILGIYLPFILTLLSLMVTIFILGSHLWNIKDTNSNFKSPKLQAVITATRTMLLCIATLVLNYLSGYYVALSLYDSAGLVPNVSMFFLSFCPTAEALTIIQASSKLRERLKVTFCCTETQRRDGGANI